jgi:hypothetical protein
MNLSAVDAIRRGLVNLRANWELLLLQILQVLLVSVLIVVGFLPPLAVLGFNELEMLDPASQDWTVVANSFAEMVARGREAWLLLLASLVLTSAIWLMATLVYCYFQGGIFGVLVAGDRQAPAGRPRGWPWFRTFTVGTFRGWAARYLWRYFWLLNLFLVLSTVWLLLPLVLVLVATWGEAKWGGAAALGIGCGGAIPVIFSVLVLAFWSQLAQADLARETSGVWIATRRGLHILGRRLGAVFVLGVMLVSVMMTVTISGAVVSAFLDFASASGSLAQWIGQVLLTFLEWVLTSIVTVAFAAILVSLVRGESSGVAPA